MSYARVLVSYDVIDDERMNAQSETYLVSVYDDEHGGRDFDSHDHDQQQRVLYTRPQTAPPCTC